MNIDPAIIASTITASVGVFGVAATIYGRRADRKQDRIDKLEAKLAKKEEIIEALQQESREYVAAMMLLKSDHDNVEAVKTRVSNVLSGRKGY